MKGLFLGAFALVMTCLPAKMFANDSANLDSLAMALVLTDLRSGAIEVSEEDGGVFDQIKDFIDETKDYLLENFDYNENGRIDLGDELDDVIVTFKEIAVLLLDSNMNGKIDREELVEAGKELAETIKQEITSKACAEIIKQAEAAGPWLKFRPILNALYQRCSA